MARVVGHPRVAELRAGYRGSGEATLARHFQVIWLLAQGRTVAATARLTSFAPRWIDALLARYNAFGPSSLGDRRRGNGTKATVLTAEVLDTLRERVKAPPDDGGVWSSSKVAAVMAAELGLGSVAEQRGWEALGAIGWTIQRPRPRHARAATLEEQAAFKESSPASSPRRPRAIPARRSRPSPPTSTASGSSRSCAGYGRRAASAPRPSAITASSGSTSPPSSRPPPARASGPSPQGSPSATSRTSSRSSPARPARVGTGLLSDNQPDRCRQPSWPAASAAGRA